MDKHIEILITKHFVNEITDVELKELKDWLHDKQNQSVYRDYIDANYVVEQSREVAYSEEDYKRLEQLLLEEKIKNRRLTSMFKYVATFIGLMLLSYVAYQFNAKQAEIAKANIINIPKDNIILAFNGGITKTLIDDAEQNITNAFGDIIGVQIGNEIVYNKDVNATKTQHNTYNTLKVPYGKTFKLTLSDGSQINLNAGSTLRYPDTFAEHTTREVYLEGEGYFVVAKDEIRPFVVKTNTMDVRVLGTQFNFSSYTNDSEKSVTLVEGSLAVQKKQKEGLNPEKTILLKPNQKAFVHLDSKSNIKIECVKVNKYIAWKDHELVFQNDEFAEIIKKLERYFNISIISNNQNLNAMHFTGRFKKQNILEILDVFKAHTAFDYKIKDKSIIISKSSFQKLK